jgi:GTP-binding protein YchF
MNPALGIIGLPNAGKSTLFNALTQAGVPVAPYPFTTVEPNLGQTAVPDARLAAVAAVTHPVRIVPAAVRFIDIAGLVRGAARGEGLGNRFLAHIREVDAVVHVVRCFTAGAVAHPEGAVDPVRDAGVVETELALADLEAVARAIERAAPRARVGGRAVQAHLAALDELAGALGRGEPLRRATLSPAARAQAEQLRLLTLKPVLYVANVDEDALPGGGPHAAALAALAEREGAGCLVLCARLEAELREVPDADARAYLASVGLEDPGLPRLIRAGFALLRLISFFTVLSREVRAWPVRAGTTAVDAAGRIHTDMARGFVRAEVVAWDALVQAGSVQAARERGMVRVEGRDYVVQDGDVITFRFAV